MSSWLRSLVGDKKILGIKGMVDYEGKTLVSRDKKKDFDLLFVLFLFFYLFFFYQSSCEFLPLDQLNSVNYLASWDTQSD